MVTITLLTLEGHLKEIYDGEVENLDLSGTSIKLWKASRPNRNLPYKEFVKEIWTATPSVRFKDGEYDFIMNDDMLEKPKYFRSCTRHELYHVRKGHFDNGVSLLKNLFFDLPTMLYQYTGLKTF